MGAGGPESCGRELCPAVAPVSVSFLVSYTLLLSLRARGGVGISPDGAVPPLVGVGFAAAMVLGSWFVSLDRGPPGFRLHPGAGPPPDIPRMSYMPLGG